MKLFHPLLALIASATNSELARQVRYLKEENRILRDRIKGEIHTTLAERRRFRPPARDDPPEENTDTSPESIVRRDREKLRATRGVRSNSTTIRLNMRQVCLDRAV